MRFLAFLVLAIGIGSHSSAEQLLDRYRVVEAAIVELSGPGEYYGYDGIEGASGPGSLLPCSSAYDVTGYDPDGYSGEFLPEKDDVVDEMLLRVAVDASSVRLRLMSSGYDSIFVEKWIDSFVRASVAEVSERTENLEILDSSYMEVMGYPDGSRSYGMLESLAAELNQGAPYNGSNWGVGGDCGDGEITAELESDPSGARIWMISEFDWLVCKYEGLNPDDIDACAWYEQTGRTSILVSGNYHVFAVWPDGTTARSRQSFMEMSPDDENVLLIKR